MRRTDGKPSVGKMVVATILGLSDESPPVAPWRVGALMRSALCLICAYANGDCLSVGMVTPSAVASISLATYW